MDKEAIISKTENWIKKVVIGLNLCPFAALPFRKDLIRYSVYEGNNLAQIPAVLIQELELLKMTPSDEIETSFLVFPHVFHNFHDYLDFVDISNNVLESIDLEGLIQIATFHPAYQFAGTGENDVENFTNRSPYPMLHFLREESVSEALLNYDYPEAIPERNIEKLKTLGLNKLRDSFGEFLG